MIKIKEILKNARKEHSWVKEMARYAGLHGPVTLSESSLEEHLSNYSNKFSNVSNFVHWNGDPRFIAGEYIPGSFFSEDAREDSRNFNPVPKFSKYYLGFVPSEKPIFPTKRLNAFIESLDLKARYLNAVIEGVRHKNSDKDFIARTFTDFASLVSLSENTLDEAIEDVGQYVKLIFDYKPGKIIVTNPFYHDKIPKDKRDLFGL